MPRENHPATKLRVGCAGWFYWHWKGIVYPTDIPTKEWFQFYAQQLDTVEINATFYRWPRKSTVKSWDKVAPEQFVYSIKVNQDITHRKRFQGTKRLIKKFYDTIAPLQNKLGCVLFQLPPSFKYSEAKLEAILTQLDPNFTNVIEFRHESWWTDAVWKVLDQAGVIFCSISAPRLPNDLISCNGKLYIRFHGSSRWYRHDYTSEELERWAERIVNAKPKEVWAYFNNDFRGCAFRNAIQLRQILQERFRCGEPSEK
jgi:uncharacterized protein YecE (DUF72 family)